MPATSPLLASLASFLDEETHSGGALLALIFGAARVMLGIRPVASSPDKRLLAVGHPRTVTLDQLGVPDDWTEEAEEHAVTEGMQAGGLTLRLAVVKIFWSSLSERDWHSPPPSLCATSA